jgi:hypothetical protein
MTARFAIPFFLIGILVYGNERSTEARKRLE